MHGIQYRTTNQGQQTRSQLLSILAQHDGLSRQELQQYGLSYDQVRRQAKNLSIEGAIASRLEGGQRRYYLVKPLQMVGTFAVVMLMNWAVPVLGYQIEDGTSPWDAGKTSLLLRLSKA